MFGYVAANYGELTPEQKKRYGAVYCGICRRIRTQASGLSRLGLSYDMAFLALLLMSLYEPEETEGKNACILHPIRHRPWVDNEYVRYAADMNVALAYYNALDDWQDDRSLTAGAASLVLRPHFPEIRARWERQCDAIERCIAELSALERDNCPNPDAPANCFGRLMGELLVFREDHWAPKLRQMGMALGRYIYLTDAVVDYRADKRRKKYNPFLAMGMEEDYGRWEQYQVLAMAKCTEHFEMLPLVQDKDILDNILYSGVWSSYRSRRSRKEDQNG